MLSNVCLESTSRHKTKDTEPLFYNLEISTIFKVIFKKFKIFYWAVRQTSSFIYTFHKSAAHLMFKNDFKEVYGIRLFICKTQTVLTLHKWVIGYAQLLHKCAARTTQYNHLLLHLAEKCCVSERPIVVCFSALMRAFPLLQCLFNVTS